MIQTSKLSANGGGRLSTGNQRSCQPRVPSKDVMRRRRGVREDMLNVTPNFPQGAHITQLNAERHGLIFRVRDHIYRRSRIIMNLLHMVDWIVETGGIVEKAPGYIALKFPVRGGLSDGKQGGRQNRSGDIIPPTKKRGNNLPSS